MPKSKSFLFRVDCSSHTGLGHVRRTLALAAALKKRGHACSFLIHDDGQELPMEISFPRISTPQGKRWDFALIDSYTIKPDECHRICEQADQSIFLADGKDPEYECDVLIDHNIYATKDFYAKRQDKTKILAGPQFAMMGEGIVQARGAEFPVKKRIEKILLTLGGKDCHERLKQLLGLLSKVAQNAEILVLIPRRESKVELPKTLPRGNRCRLLKAPKDISQIMCKVDLALSAAGVTILELACIGVPTMCVVIDDNQIPGAEALEAQKIGKNLGEQEHWTEGKFRPLFRDLEATEHRKAMSQRGRELVDGQGPGRIADALGA